MPDYYSIPVSFSNIIQKKEIRKISLESSIKENILLILMSHYGEHRYNKSFGCCIWDQDFELLPSENVWRSELKKSITDSIDMHEPRLNELNLTVVIDEEPFLGPDDLKSRRIKKRLLIKVKAKIKQTDEDFYHEEAIFISPISLD